MSKKPKEKKAQAFVRVDGGHKMGLGHLVRSLAMAHMIKKNFHVHFFSKEIPSNFVDKIKSAGFGFTKISCEENFIDTSGEANIVVLDLLDLQSFYQEEVQKRSSKLVVIDDLHSGYFSADLIINHAPGIRASDYEADYNTQFALGLDYTLLRPKFLKEASSKVKASSNLENLFICFGGSDTLNLTKRSLGIALSNPSFKSINVVVGNAYSFLEDLKDFSALHDNVRIYHDVSEGEMIEVMRDSGLAIVPASGILLEVLTAGLSAISGMYVANQKFFYENYKKKDLIIDAEDFSEEAISSAIETALKGSRQKIDAIDGRSGSRILKLFKSLAFEDQVDLQKAEPKDVDLTYKWATSPTVRAFAFSKEEIIYEEHEQWFLQKIASPETLYLLANYNKKTVGSIRFDEIRTEPVISYLIDPDYHGLGLGSIILKKGVKVLKEVIPSASKVIGKVLPENIPSIKIFERLGYEKELINGEFYEFTKKL